jgi:hypothetical protein
MGLVLNRTLTVLNESLGCEESLIIFRRAIPASTARVCSFRLPEPWRTAMASGRAADCALGHPLAPAGAGRTVQDDSALGNAPEPKRRLTRS